ncbi:MAG TPA: UDP-N-acetylglucosamine 1-carboxyvinyltransferase [Candidatus Limnocylindrales bacterium]|nr:UDP-N-acetylglucosamine 1-carboxyvinyltransferase [Candidatus Limnocylindrales bacterium]
MRIRVEGKTPLSGTYRPAGSANAAQALIAAALLTEAPVTLRNIPRTLSTLAMIDQASRLGAVIAWQPEGELTIDAATISRRALAQGESDASIGVILFLPALLSRRQHARLEVDFPLNRIRTHLEALRDLGQDVVIQGSAVEVHAAPWDYKDILLSQTSVTATALVMMLASRLGRETAIHNAATEPHLQQLGCLLQQMGVRIEQLGSNVVRVFGAETLGAAEATVGSDVIEAASVAAIAALTGGRLQIVGIDPGEVRLIARIFWRLGIQMELSDELIYIPRHDLLSVSNREEDVDSSIETAPWPGFPSDLVAVATVIATQSRGTSLIHEKLYANRLLFVDKLKAMGAQIVLCDPHRAIVMGPTPLHGIYLDSPDVRTGLGMLGAALVADRETIIDNAQALEHTFGGVLGRLQAINAGITLVEL